MFKKRLHMKTAGLRIVLPGGSGHIGQLLARHFHDHGHRVVVLSRRPSAASWQVVGWDGRTLDHWVKELEGADLVINLAGRSVNCRYTAANRREIMESRIFPTRIIGDAIARCSQPPAVWMNASTATIYRHALDRPMDEASGELGGNEADAPASWRFSIEVATQWEQTFFAADTPRTRKIALRSAVVMSPTRGGAFHALLNLVRAGLGGKAASGKQFVSWIHQTDFVNAIEFLIAQPHLEGCINLSSPNPLPNCDFMCFLREALGIPVGMPSPAWMLEMGAFFLRTETELILKSRRVVPGRLLEAGFQFTFPEWKPAADDLVDLWRLQETSGQKRPCR
jgi:uncharacterized protein (TIGR01777 family)